MRFRYSAAGPVLFNQWICELKQGVSYGVVGSGGSGKSTLLRRVAGLLPQARKTPAFVSPRGLRLKRSVFSKAKRAHEPIDGLHPEATCLMVFQDGGLLDDWSVERNCELGAVGGRFSSSLFSSKKRSEVLSAVGLKEHSQKRVSELSGGMKKRLGLARALLCQPDLLLADSLDLGLDPITSRQIFDLLSEWKLQMTLVLTSISLLPLVHYVDEVWILDQGQRTWSGAQCDALQAIRDGLLSAYTPYQLES